MKMKILFIALVGLATVLGVVENSQASFADDYKFGTPVILGPNINSAYADTQPVLTADGNTLFFASNRPGGFGGYDVYTAERVDGVWLPATNLGSLVNTARDDQLPAITPDGNRLFLTSSQGQPSNYYSRTWTSQKLNGVWQAPVLLPPAVNFSWANNNSQFVSADGRWLYMSCWGGYGYWDIYRVDITTGSFSVIEHLLSPINTGSRDFAVYQTADGKYFVVWTDSGGWRVLAWEQVNGVYVSPVVLPSPFLYRFSMAESESLLYSNLNQAGGYGSDDIYVSQRIYDCSKFGISSFAGSEQIINPLPLAGQRIHLDASVSGASNLAELAWILSANGQVVAEGVGIADGIGWDGRNGEGKVVPGTYDLLLSVTSINGSCVSEQSLTVILELTDECKLRATFP